ncbi:hypothetical protein V6Z11_A11G231100 [Gossypium hirsutum]
MIIFGLVIPLSTPISTKPRGICGRFARLGRTEE